MLTVVGLQKYYDYLASQKTVIPTKEKVDRNKRDEILSRDDSASSGTKKKKKGKRFLRLIESYSKHVEGLQMIQ